MICWRCGKEGATETRGYGKLESSIIVPFEGQRHYCPECLAAERKEQEQKLIDYVKLKKELMFERALKMIEKSGESLYPMREEIDTINNYMHEHIDKFDSAHEIVAAIYLLKDRIDMRIQHKIGRYRCDFYLPFERIVLEIDGEVHKNTLYKDNERDITIRGQLGKEWETIRISTNFIEQNPKKLVEAMRKLKEYKQEIRAHNSGILPEWYSKREWAKRPKRTKIGDDKLLKDGLS